MQSCRDAPYLWIDSGMVISSTYFHNPELPGDGILRSFTMIKKSTGPNFVPWGTPAVTGRHSEVTSPSLTHCRQSVKKLAIHGISDRLTPISTNFCMRTLWPIRSNPLEKYKKRRRRWYPGGSMCTNLCLWGSQIPAHQFYLWHQRSTILRQSLQGLWRDRLWVI